MLKPTKGFTSSVRCPGCLQGGFEKQQVYGDVGWVLFLRKDSRKQFCQKSSTSKPKSGRSLHLHGMCVSLWFKRWALQPHTLSWRGPLGSSQLSPDERSPAESARLVPCSQALWHASGCVTILWSPMTTMLCWFFGTAEKALSINS